MHFTYLFSVRRTSGHFIRRDSCLCVWHWWRQTPIDCRTKDTSHRLSNAGIRSNHCLQSAIRSSEAKSFASRLSIGGVRWVARHVQYFATNLSDLMQKANSEIINQLILSKTNSKLDFPLSVDCHRSGVGRKWASLRTLYSPQHCQVRTRIKSFQISTNTPIHIQHNRAHTHTHTHCPCAAMWSRARIYTWH